MEKIENLNDLDSLTHCQRIQIIKQEIVRVCMKSGFKSRDNVIKGYNYALLKMVDMLLSESCVINYKILEKEEFEDVDIAYALNDRNYNSVTVINPNSEISHTEFFELVYILDLRIKSQHSACIDLVNIASTSNMDMFIRAKLRRAWFEERNINIAKEMLLAKPSELLATFNKIGLRYIDLEEQLHDIFDDMVYLSKEDLSATFLREFYRFKLAGWTPVCS